MSPGSFLELADPASGLRAWLGTGQPGLAADELVLIAFEGETLLAAGPAGGSLELEDGRARARAELGELSIEVEAAGAGNGLCAGTASATLRNTGTERFIEALAAFGSEDKVPDGEPGLVRRLSVLPPGGGTTITVSSRRLAAATEHEAESLRAWLLPESGELREVSEPLLSTQYDSAGAQARAGLELWVDESDPAPLRVAGVRRTDAEVELAGGWRLRAAFFRWLLAGEQAEGSYLIWRRGG